MTIHLKNVEFYYPKFPDKNILNINDWFVEHGSKQFIYGPSGSGKSTLLNLICGLLVPTSGSVSVLGESLEKMSSRQRDRFRANNIGYIFQQFNLVNYLSALDNIKLANHFAHNGQTKKIENKSIALLERLAINSDEWSRPVQTLSIGQQQRISIARAFVNSPKLIIADEPTSSLDETSRDTFLSLLTTLCDHNKTTLLFVSHDTRLKPHFDLVQHFSDINHKKGNR